MKIGVFISFGDHSTTNEHTYYVYYYIYKRCVSQPQNVAIFSPFNTFCGCDRQTSTFWRQSGSLEIGEGVISAYTNSLIYLLSVKSVDSINKDRSFASLTRKWRGCIHNQVSVDAWPQGKKCPLHPRWSRDVPPEHKGKPKGVKASRVKKWNWRGLYSASILDAGYLWKG